MIADRALSTPANTEQLMELKQFMVKAEEKDLVQLGERMLEARHRSGPAPPPVSQLPFVIVHTTFKWVEI